MMARYKTMAPGPQDSPAGIYHWWSCPDCGKRAYGHRKDAKRALKTHVHKERLRVYRCGDGWHIGHIADPIVTGDASRDDIYGSAA